MCLRYRRLDHLAAMTQHSLSVPANPGPRIGLATIHLWQTKRPTAASENPYAKVSTGKPRLLCLQGLPPPELDDYLQEGPGTQLAPAPWEAKATRFSRTTTRAYCTKRHTIQQLTRLPKRASSGMPRHTSPRARRSGFPCRPCVCSWTQFRQQPVATGRFLPLSPRSSASNGCVARRACACVWNIAAHSDNTWSEVRVLRPSLEW